MERTKKRWGGKKVGRRTGFWRASSPTADFLTAADRRSKSQSCRMKLVAELYTRLEHHHHIVCALLRRRRLL
eukprot:scaffold3964_cov77-Skeletonema_marinoi.AAC.13